MHKIFQPRFMLIIWGVVLGVVVTALSLFVSTTNPPDLHGCDGGNPNAGACFLIPISETKKGFPVSFSKSVKYQRYDNYPNTDSEEAPVISASRSAQSLALNSLVAFALLWLTKKYFVREHANTRH